MKSITAKVLTDRNETIKTTAWKVAPGSYRGHATCTRTDGVFVPDALVSSTDLFGALRAAADEVQASLARIGDDACLMDDGTHGRAALGDDLCPPCRTRVDAIERSSREG